MVSKKVSRREAIKVLTAAGAAIAAMPYLASASAREHKTPQPVAIRGTNRNAASDGKEPLVIVVKDGEVFGYRGQEEVRIGDLALGAQLHQAFQSNRRA
jgi:hypothetical protein